MRIRSNSNATYRLSLRYMIASIARNGIGGLFFEDATHPRSSDASAFHRDLYIAYQPFKRWLQRSSGEAYLSPALTFNDPPSVRYSKSHLVTNDL